MSCPEFGGLLISSPEFWDQSSLELVPDIHLTIGTGKIEQFLTFQAVKTPAVILIDSTLQSQRLQSEVLAIILPNPTPIASAVLPHL